MSTHDLTSELREACEALPVPPGDLDRAVREGGRLRRRRGLALGGAAGATVLAGVVALALLVGGGSDGPRVLDPAGLGPFDTSGGLRGYADPGGDLHLGGRTFEGMGQQLGDLDTGASGTQHGVVHSVSGRPRLLAPDGRSYPLVASEVDDRSSFRPGSRADGTAPTAVVATLHEGTATLHLVDVSRRTTLARRTLDCPGSCDSLRLDALDEGRVFLRGPDGAAVWDTGDDSWTSFDPRTRVADVRAGVVLHDGPPAPQLEALGLRQVSGAIDSQLTFDGRHVLAWSSRLAPTTPGGKPLRLQRGPGGTEPRDRDALAFWSIDSDGSVLVATTRRYPRYDVVDCDPVTGRCEEVGGLRPSGGDPVFLGNDS